MWRLLIPSRRALVLAAVISLLWGVAAGAVQWKASQYDSLSARERPRLERAFKQTSNVSQMIALPVLAPAWRVLGTAVWSLPGMLAINIVAATGWSACVLLALGVRRVVIRQGSETQTAFNASRRRFLVDVPMGVVGCAGTGALLEATIDEPWNLKVRRYDIAMARLPSVFDGLRVVQVSDTHLGRRVPGIFIERSVRMALSLEPDVVVLTGDYIHLGAAMIERAAELFAPLTAAKRRDGAPMPVFGVLGNHDWVGDPVRLSDALRRIGVHMIDNDRVFLSANGSVHRREPTTEPRLCLAGLGDLYYDSILPERALDGVEADTVRIVLAHNPDTAEELKVVNGPRIDLMLSGHTHGGQVKLPVVGTPIVASWYGSKYAGGVVQAPAFRVVVSRGVGMSLLPVRFGVPPEVVEITLRRV